jgi:hypothetical protein
MTTGVHEAGTTTGITMPEPDQAVNHLFLHIYFTTIVLPYAIVML